MARTLDDDDDAELFSAAIAGTRPIPRDAFVPAARPRNRLAARPSARPAFVIERDGDQVRGHAPDAPERALHLIDGDVEPDATLDLHGMTADAADRSLTRFLGEAVRNRRRVVLVVHGRGLHSGGAGPVLREATIDALSGRLADQVSAFSTAGRRHGGPGALYVVTRC